MASSRYMRPLAKVGLVAAGYIGAFAVASAVVAVHIATTSGTDRQQYGAMFSFGDDLLFLAVFGAAAVVPYATALFFLRPYRLFWRVLSVTALLVAATTVLMFNYFPPQPSAAHSAAKAWLAFAGLLRILISPFFALGCLVATVIAPSRRPRLALLVATAMESTVFVWIAFTWFFRFRPQ